MDNTKRHIQILLLVLLTGVIGVIGSLLAAWFIGGRIFAPAAAQIKGPQISARFTNVSFLSKSGSEIKGWLFHGNYAKPAIALFHGIKSNRTSMEARAAFFISQRFNVLLIDLQAHGQSNGKFISIGLLESADARAAIAFLRNKYPQSKLAALGVSLGGAACLLGRDALQVDALIAEAVYTNITDATKNRLEVNLGRWSRWMSFLLLKQLSWRLGIDPEELSPERSIKTFRNPILIIAGELDRHTTFAESQRLFANANHAKEFWIVPGAAHVDFHKFAKSAYERKVLRFLQWNGFQL